MKRTLIREILERKIDKGDSGDVYGWVYAKRGLGEKGFLIIKDRSGSIQATLILTEKFKQNFDSTNIGDIIRLKGIIKRDKREIFSGRRVYINVLTI